MPALDFSIDALRLSYRAERARTAAKRYKEPHLPRGSVAGMSSLFFIGADLADPMPGKNERQGRSANIFFFHEDSLQGHKKPASHSVAAVFAVQ